MAFRPESIPSITSALSCVVLSDRRVLRMISGRSVPSSPSSESSVSAELPSVLSTSPSADSAAPMAAAVSPSVSSTRPSVALAVSSTATVELSAVWNSSAILSAVRGTKTSPATAPASPTSEAIIRPSPKRRLGWPSLNRRMVLPSE